MKNVVFAPEKKPLPPDVVNLSGYRGLYMVNKGETFL